MKKHLFRPFALTGGVLTVWLLATSINVPLGQGSSQTSSTSTTIDLTQGSVVKAGFNGGEKKVFHLRLQANQYLKALAGFEKADGPEALSSAPILNNLGLLYHQQGDFLKAEPFYARSIAIRKKYLAPNHPSIAFILNNLADMYSLRSDLKQAIFYQSEAVSILEKAFGDNHPQTILLQIN